MDIARTAAATATLAATALGATWLLAGTHNPLDHPGRPFSSALSTYPEGWANAVFLGCALVALAAACWPRRGREWAAGAAIVALVALMDASTLIAIGYLPATLIGPLFGLAEADASLFLSPGLLLQLLLLTAVAAFGVVIARRFRAAGHDLAHVTARTRFWTRIAIEAPLVYALTRVLMFFGVPGFDMAEFGAPILWAGLGLAVSASLGAWLTYGLVRPWGEVFPRWLPGLRDKRVPIRLAVVPGLLVAVMVATASKDMLQSLGDDGALSAIGDWPLVALPMLLWPLWAIALAMATANYGIRRSLTEAKISPEHNGTKMVYIPLTGAQTPKISGN
ncbi:hypothetical protein [Actinophytocola algeriensis]|uniref:Uncharacterized protein n=1 Tax=Actinophytocola algeriensis TaxID=1768010 RepID=A0A7W7VD58_9PSEU|nr:hypothetical protein [Actinophytocola algeriensis]MBB4905744.1 hypothetical protein [Actinophytocola algeriensis]MBE1472571.1 hypothetical protein [Actinophytocola algeriensis]